MTVLVQTLVPGLNREQYESIAANLIDKLKASPGFLAHYAYEDDGGMTVVEVWEAAAQHDAWLDNSVRPNLPVEVTPVKHELANEVTA
jgi:heme-degrading monooxygenase HmoA